MTPLHRSPVVRLTATLWFGAPDRQLTMDREQVKVALGQGAVPWDVRPTRDYQYGHLPRAVSVGGVDWLLADPRSDELVPAEIIERVLKKVGIGRGCQVVVYGDRRCERGFIALRALNRIGVDTARVYLGGFDDWREHAERAREERVERMSPGLPPLSEAFA